MKKLMKRIVLLAAMAALVLGMASCGAKDDGKLKVQFVPTNNDGSMEAKAKPFAKYLSDKLGKEVEVTLATDYSTIVEAMASGKVDIGIMPPAAYVQARNQDAAEALLTSQLGAFNVETGLPEKDKLSKTFKGEVLVKADSEIKTLEDLKGKKIATLSPNSASGYIYPVAEMKNLGIDPTVDCTITTVNDIPSEMTSVLNGQQDACFVFQGARVVFSKAFEGKDIMKELRVLYLTEGNIPNDAIAVIPKMDADLKEKVKDVFLNMNKDEDGKAAMALWSHKGYDLADDSDYDTVEAYTKKAAE